jgi:hypothetical protein
MNIFTYFKLTEDLYKGTEECEEKMERSYGLNQDFLLFCWGEFISLHLNCLRTFILSTLWYSVQKNTPY